MADTEIFVDGIATKRFNDLNSFETVRAEIKQNPNVSNDHIENSIGCSSRRRRFLLSYYP